jgi:hypothetical protein
VADLILVNTRTNILVARNVFFITEIWSESCELHSPGAEISISVHRCHFQFIWWIDSRAIRNEIILLVLGQTIAFTDISVCAFAVAAIFFVRAVNAVEFVVASLLRVVAVSTVALELIWTFGLRADCLVRSITRAVVHEIADFRQGNAASRLTLEVQFVAFAVGC